MSGKGVSVRSVMSGEQEVPVIEWRESARDHLVKVQKGAGRFRHLALVHIKEFSVQPKIHPRVGVTALGLGYLVGVMDRDMIDAATVDVKMLTKVLARHRGALDMSARKSRPPWGCTLPSAT
jgi:hypothetical protein